jgi:DNA-directed RNA polymerase subunit L
MNTKILGQSSNLLKLEVTGGNSEVLHLIVQGLLKDKGVTFAAYRQDHHLFDVYTLIIRTEKKKPKTVLNKTIKDLSADLDSFKKQLLKVVK